MCYSLFNMRHWTGPVRKKLGGIKWLMHLSLTLLIVWWSCGRSIVCLFQGEFYTQHDLAHHISNSSIFSFPCGHPVGAYVYFLFLPSQFHDYFYNICTKYQLSLVTGRKLNVCPVWLPSSWC